MRGPDLIFGGDVRKFFPPACHFTGVIGGPPCQNFSGANRDKDFSAGMELVNEFLRVVGLSQPEFWLMENVAGSPNCDCPGYAVQRFTLDASHVGSEQHRLRKFHYGHRPGTPEIILKRDAAGVRLVPQQTEKWEPIHWKFKGDVGYEELGKKKLIQRTCMASEGNKSNRRDWKEFCRLQGLPDGFDLPGFTVAEKYRAVGNGVPFPLACALANAIAQRGRNVSPLRVCADGCGAFVTGREIYATSACRKRAQRLRDADTKAATSQLEFA